MELPKERLRIRRAHVFDFQKRRDLDNNKVRFVTGVVVHQISLGLQFVARFAAPIPDTFASWGVVLCLFFMSLIMFLKSYKYRKFSANQNFRPVLVII